MTREESVVLTPRAFCAPSEFDKHDSSRRKATMKWGHCGRGHLRRNAHAPPVEALRCRDLFDRVNAGPVAADKLRDDAQICAPSVAIGEFLCGRQDESRGEVGEASLAIFFHLVEQLVPVLIHHDVMLRQDRSKQPLAVREMILERRSISLARFAVDFAERYRVDASLRE